MPPAYLCWTKVHSQLPPPCRPGGYAFTACLAAAVVGACAWLWGLLQGGYCCSCQSLRYHCSCCCFRYSCNYCFCLSPCFPGLSFLNPEANRVNLKKDYRTQNLLQKFFWRSANISLTQCICTCGSCYLAAQWYLTLCDPMDCSMTGFHVLHYLLEFAQIHVHWVIDAI